MILLQIEPIPFFKRSYKEILSYILALIVGFLLASVLEKKEMIISPIVALIGIFLILVLKLVIFQNIYVFKIESDTDNIEITYLWFNKIRTNIVPKNNLSLTEVPYGRGKGNNRYRFKSVDGWKIYQAKVGEWNEILFLRLTERLNEIQL